MTKAGERMLEAVREMVTMEKLRRENERFASFLRAIGDVAARAAPDDLKVEAMRRLAAEALGEG